MGQHPSEDEAVHYGQPRKSVPDPSGGLTSEGDDFTVKTIHYREKSEPDRNMNGGC